MHDWRPVFAALSDPERRTTLARITVAEADGTPFMHSSLTTAERRRVAALQRAGLVTIDGDAVLSNDPFTAALGHRPAASGIDRFLRAGRIASWPAKPADRAALLQWAAAEVLPDDESHVDERLLTERLAQISADPATLRRDLVDAGLFARSADGSRYWRVGETAPQTAT